MPAIEYTLRDFAVGQRVKLCPSTDQFMMGLNRGTVTKVGQKFIHVRFDRTDARGRHYRLRCLPQHLLFEE